MTGHRVTVHGPDESVSPLVAGGGMDWIELPPWAGCSCGWQGTLALPIHAETSRLTAEWADHAASAS